MIMHQMIFLCLANNDLSLLYKKDNVPYAREPATGIDRFVLGSRQILPGTRNKVPSSDYIVLDEHHNVVITDRIEPRYFRRISSAN